MIYVHIPFCRSFCTYCDFYSEVAARCSRNDEERFGQYSEALSREISLRADEITADDNTLYIGGGTPSVLPLSVFGRLVSVLEEAGHGGPYDEFTVEVNPEDIVEKGEGYVEGLLDLGVNRISMGVQSFDDDILRWMNRRHDAGTAIKAYAILENAGVRNISIDLIFGLSQLSDTQWTDTLKKALEVSSRGDRPQHISSYQLSVEPGSALNMMVEKGMWKEASDDLCEHQYHILCEELRKAGYAHYEISNFALPGFEARHNSAYWHHKPYAGFGPGAHSFISPNVRQWNEPDLQAYLKAGRNGDFSVVQGRETLNEEQLMMERVMLGLRTSAGLEGGVLERCCDASGLDRALSDGSLVRTENGRVRIPEDRFFISDAIITELI